MQRNKADKLFLCLFLSFKKALYEVIASGLQFSFDIFQWPSTWYTVNTNCTKL